MPSHGMTVPLRSLLIDSMIEFSLCSVYSLAIEQITRFAMTIMPDISIT